MTTRGTVRGNMIELDLPTPLPEGCRVELQLQPINDGSVSIAQRLALLETTRGSIRADAALVSTVLSEDYFGVE
ncbi:MAG: hypothetical protein ACO1SX_05115 [Actinomycetota bacterium]